MEQATRNKLRNTVTRCRRLLEESVAQQLQGQFGIFAGKKDAVQIEDEARMSHLSDEDRQYRGDLLDHLEHIKARGFKPKDALDQLIREIAFTHLNRLCAYKMMEAREVYVGGQKFREAVSRSINSNGFKFYLADHPEDERLFNTGNQELAYRHFLDWLGGLLSEEIGVLFNPNDPANRLYPLQKTLDELLGLLNDQELAGIWEQDETIGWVYQYFTPKELRDQARKESQAPRNSYELAFRNQFFTPRYVVEFLTDNTLGRIWYEMRKGETRLKDQCRYMVRRPTEIFLDEGQEPPATPESQDDLSQEELLKQPVHIPHRPKKDPRELKILDPACGSGHFLLYCFDLLLTIYGEAYEDPDIGPALQQDYPTLDDLRRDVPRLILAHNLHGIDIDLRCTQIAALALWLRCQRAYQEMGLKNDRSKITRSNLVCAEPMPGEEGLLEEFLKTLHEDRLPKLIRRVIDVPEDKPVRATPEMADRLCELVRLVWDRMKLAGEAGSLLKIEEELQKAIRKGQEEWEEDQPLFRVTQYALTEEPQEKYIRVISGEGLSFWERAEALVMAALNDFTEYAANGQKLLRKLFVDDAMRGFAFVDLCRQRFDVVLMNPPFGDASRLGKEVLSRCYPRTKQDLYAAFVERWLERLLRGSILGAITSRTGFFLTTFQQWREEILLGGNSPSTIADLGYGVLDAAMVETAAYCVESTPTRRSTSFFRLLEAVDKDRLLIEAVQSLCEGKPTPEYFSVVPTAFRRVPKSPFAYWVNHRVRSLFEQMDQFEADGRMARQGAVTGDDAKYVRSWWEVKLWEGRATLRWVPFAKSGKSLPYYCDTSLVVPWDSEQGTFTGYTGLLHRPSLSPANASLFFLPGLTWPLRASRFCPALLPSGCVFSIRGYAIIAPEKDLWFILGVTASTVFDFLFKVALGRFGYPEFVVGVLQLLPFPNLTQQSRSEVVEAAQRIYLLRRRAHTVDETDHAFILPALLQLPHGSLAQGLVEWQGQIAEIDHECARLQTELDAAVQRLYGVDGQDLHIVHDSRPAPFVSKGATLTMDEDESNEADELAVEAATSALAFVADLLSYSVGCTLGRWDLRNVGSAILLRDVSDALDPLPVCPPGMLQGPNGLPATPEDVPNDYPLHIDWDGILIDDPSHQNDIVRRVRDVLEVIWKDRAEAIEQEACEILGVKTLRDYFRKLGKGGFWDDHVKRYSKSRRKAPIYWLLQSSKKNYALWLYYHRLDQDMLFKALLNYVEPKIQREENRLGELRARKSSAGDSGKEAKKLAREIEQQEDLLSELRDFEEKLRKAANLHLVPDLNDGVVLNIAPLHELVPWKEAKKYWDELLDGKYEWSTIGKQLREKGLVASTP